MAPDDTAVGDSAVFAGSSLLVTSQEPTCRVDISNLSFPSSVSWEELKTASETKQTEMSRSLLRCHLLSESSLTTVFKIILPKPLLCLIFLQSTYH